MKYLLDTDTCIAALRGDPGAVGWLQGKAPVDCVVSSVTVYELAVGVAKCRDPRRESAKVDHFLATVRVMPFDGPAARKAAEIRAGLEKRGLGIGPYDTLLAGQAVAHGWQIVTGNRDEFSRVPGLDVAIRPA
jgi:tRNA(fMet)-specific endonuclease VapC